MAVPLEFCCAVFRKDRIAANFPGGLDAFFTFCDAPTYLEDDNLIRVSFMTTSEAYALVNRTVEQLSAGPQESFAAVVDLSVAPANLPAWLGVGDIDDSRCAWLAGSPPGAVKAGVRCFTARFFCVPFDLFVDRLAELGVSVADSSTATDVTFCRQGARVDAVIGIDDDRNLFGILTQLPATRSASVVEHNLLLDDIQASLEALGWDGNT